MATTCQGCAGTNAAPAFCPHCGAEINRVEFGDYYIDIGNDAQSYRAHRLDKSSDAAAKHALRRIIRSGEWPTPVVGRLYRWDHVAGAPASKPLMTVEVPS